MALPITPYKLAELEATDRFNIDLTGYISDAVLSRMLLYAPKHKTNAEKISVKCNSCKSDIASYMHEKGEKLEYGWGLEYYYKATKDGWIGCVCPNLSPEGIKFLCACGNDNRPANDNGKKKGTLGAPNLGFTYKVVTK